MIQKLSPVRLQKSRGEKVELRRAELLLPDLNKALENPLVKTLKSCVTPRKACKSSQHTGRGPLFSFLFLKKTNFTSHILETNGLFHIAQILSAQVMIGSNIIYRFRCHLWNHTALNPSSAISTCKTLCQLFQFPQQ